MSNGYLTGCALIVATIITIFLFSKTTINSYETRIFKKMSLLNVFEALTTTLIVVVALTSNSIFLFKVLNKIDVNIIIWWLSLFLIYIGYVCKIKKIEILKKAVIILNILFFISSLFLPLNIISTDKVLDSNGLLINITFIYSMIIILVMILIILFSLKNKINYRKLLPLFFFNSIMLLVALLRAKIPQVNFISILISLSNLIMVFTIENPDVKMLDELYKNKNIMEQTYDDKSNFLFAATQEVKRPLLSITNTCNELKDSEDISKLKEGLGKVRIYSKQLDFILNDILDVSSLSSQTIKFIDNKYDLSRLYEEIVLRVNAVLPKTVKFTSKKPHEIPKLYGDSIKLKQVITSILQNSIKNTKSGFIEFTIDTIEKFDAIRLIITIKDSSGGIPIDKINEILTITGNLDVEDIKDLEQNEINLKLCSKVAKLMGGNMMIRSDESKGTEISLIIDQKIALEKVDEKLSIYENLNKTTKNVIIVNQDKNIEEILKLKIKENNITASYLLNGDALIDRIKSGRKYDYIIVGDELKGISGTNILKELKKIEGFKTPIIIIIDKNKENLEEHYLKLGFDNYILPSNFEEDLDNIISKY